MALVKYNNNSLSGVTAASSLPTGAMTLIKSQTASSSSDVNFVHGTSDVTLDSTYPIYKFVWINCHPGTDDAAGFRVNFRDGDRLMMQLKQAPHLFLIIEKMIAKLH